MQEKKSKPEWIKMNQKELEELILEIAKKEKNPSKIGIILRDQHGIPKGKILGKKITRVLKEKSISFEKESDLTKKRVNNLERHINSHKRDFSAKKALIKKLWIVNKA